MDKFGFNLNPLTLSFLSLVCQRLATCFLDTSSKVLSVYTHQSVKILLVKSLAFFNWTLECSLKCLIFIFFFSCKTVLFVMSNFNNFLLSLSRWLPPLFVIFLSADSVKPINHSLCMPSNPFIIFVALLGIPSSLSFLTLWGTHNCARYSQV